MPTAIAAVAIEASASATHPEGTVINPDGSLTPPPATEESS